MHIKWWMILLSAFVVVPLAYAFILHPFMNRWGATPAEVAMSLPGDELIASPSMGYTRAVTIDAPPEKVYPWLVQMGQGRGGMYSYDGLENLVGCDIHSADTIHPEWQDTRPGDKLRFGPEGYPYQYFYQLEPDRYVLLWGGEFNEDGALVIPPLTPGSMESMATWLLYLDEQPDGTTRLISRSANQYAKGFAGFAMWRTTEFLNFMMEQRMLHTIKRLVESGAGDATLAANPAQVAHRP